MIFKQRDFTAGHSEFSTRLWRNEMIIIRSGWISSMLEWLLFISSSRSSLFSV